MALPHERQHFTYADYLKLDDDVRYEVIDGQVYDMSPSPTPKHQDILGGLYAEFRSYLSSKDCRVFISPIDVCLSDEKEDLDKIKEWVIPDMVVVCDKNKIDKKRIVGTPDLLVEVLSPSTAKRDKLVKYNRYQRAGVKEYWIVDPANEAVEVYLLEDSVFNRNGVYGKSDTLPVRIFDDFVIELSKVFVDED